MKKVMLAMLVMVGVIMTHSTVQAENWGNWRGPNFNGTTEAENLPTEWSNTENVVWKAPMPGESAATPAIWGDRVFVSSLDANSMEMFAICLDRANGEELWRKTVGLGYGEQRLHNKTSPSPVTDGELVYFYYGTGDLVCYDFEGEKVWERQLEKDFGSFSIQWGYGSSPLLYEGKLYIPVLQRDTELEETGEPRESFILAIDPKTGEDIWKHIRPSDARQESLESYVTPIPFEHDGQKHIIIHGGDYTTAHDAETGEEIWRFGSYNPRKIGHWRIVPSPVTGAGKVFTSAPKRAPLYAIDGSSKGEVALGEEDWKFEANPTDVCTPAFYKGRLFVYDGDQYVLSCLDPDTGEVLWKGDLGGQKVYRSSPTIADDKIYCMNEDGLIVVADVSGDEYKELSRIEMGEGPSRSAIAVSGNQLFIRTAENLYCIAEQ